MSNSLRPHGYSPQGSSMHGIFQARILKWVAISSSRRSKGQEIEPTSLVSPALAGGFFTYVSPRKPKQNAYFCQLFLEKALENCMTVVLPFPPSKSIKLEIHDLAGVLAWGTLGMRCVVQSSLPSRLFLLAGTPRCCGFPLGGLGGVPSFFQKSITGQECHLLNPSTCSSEAFESFKF